ncbi:MAG: hypothetical protein HFJ89_08910 [Oscillospiraceae bacterium]|jgi:hypothetical protein|nr:hypothetical protein [Oscillospiraceae bacterium]
MSSDRTIEAPYRSYHQILRTFPASASDKGHNPQADAVSVLASSESGNLTRIDNAIASVPIRIERYCNELDRIKTELADSQKEVNQPFEHEAELAEKKQALERLTDDINADKVK